MKYVPKTKSHLRNALLCAAATLGIALAASSPAVSEPRAATATQPPVDDGLPMPGFAIEPGSTALVITDPQNVHLSPDGLPSGRVGERISANRTVKNLRRNVSRMVNSP